MSSVTNKYLPPVFDTVKNDNEEIIWLEKPKYVPHVLSDLLDLKLIFFSIAFITIGFLLESVNGGKYYAWILAFLILSPSIISVIFKVLSYNNTYYGYSDKRIFIRSGFIGSNFKIIDYDKILEIEVTVNIIEKIYGVGSVKFFSGRIETDSDNITTRKFDKWEAISNPHQVFKMVKKVAVDIKTDYNFPNALRPDINPGYGTIYKK